MEQQWIVDLVWIVHIYHTIPPVIYHIGLLNILQQTMKTLSD